MGALREEFEYVAFRCCYCYYWNPARKQRPVAPRLTAAAERPVPASNSSESSGSDVSAPQSAAGSRRGSISKVVEEKVIEHEDKVVQNEELESEVIDGDEGSDNNTKDTETKEATSESLLGKSVEAIVNPEESVAENVETDQVTTEVESDKNTADEINIKTKDTNENVMEVDS